MSVLHFLYPAAFLFAVLSCSIKESRDDCPCCLNILLEDTSRKVVSVEVRDGQRLFEDVFSGSRTSCSHIVSRGSVDVAAICGIDSCRVKGMSVFIPYGRQMDAVSAYHKILFTECETLTDTVVLSKSYATVYIRFSDMTEDAHPFSVEALSSTRGYDFLLDKAIPGDFRYRPVSEDGVNYQMRIPRQGDNSLLIVVESTGFSEENVDPLVVRLGEYLKNAGYDWTATELNDIYVEIDRLPSGFNVVIDDWILNHYEESI